MIFRYKAWDKLEEVLCDVHVITMDKGAFLVGNSKTVPRQVPGTSIIASMPAVANTGHFCNFENIEMLPLTGKFDSKGIELFVGAVWRGDAEPFDHNYIVEYDEHEASFKLRTSLGSGPHGDTHHVPGLKESVYGQIIGNVFENPELSEQLS